MIDSSKRTIDPLVAAIAALEDFVVVLAFETWLLRVEPLIHDEKSVIAGVPVDGVGIDGQTLAMWASDAQTSEAPLDPAFSAIAARAILVAAVAAPSLRPYVEQAVKHPDDKKLKAGVTIKVGALATALMLVASTGFELRTETMKISKEPLSAENIAAIANLVNAIRGYVPSVHQSGTRTPK